MNNYMGLIMEGLRLSIIEVFFLLCVVIFLFLYDRKTKQLLQILYGRRQQKNEVHRGKRPLEKSGQASKLS
jgi:hypothetical protein